MLVFPASLVSCLILWGWMVGQGASGTLWYGGLLGIHQDRQCATRGGAGGFGTPARAVGYTSTWRRSFATCIGIRMTDATTSAVTAPARYAPNHTKQHSRASPGRTVSIKVLRFTWGGHTREFGWPLVWPQLVMGGCTQTK